MGLSPTARVDSATCRRAGYDDVQAVADLLNRSRRAAIGAIPAPVHSDAETHEWISTVVIPDREVWLMEDADSRPLGAALHARRRPRKRLGRSALTKDFVDDARDRCGGVD